MSEQVTVNIVNTPVKVTVAGGTVISVPVQRVAIVSDVAPAVSAAASAASAAASAVAAAAAGAAAAAALFAGITAASVLYAGADSLPTYSANLTFTDTISVGILTVGQSAYNSSVSIGTTSGPEITGNYGRGVRGIVSFGNGSGYDLNLLAGTNRWSGLGYVVSYGIGTKITASTATTDIQALSTTQTWNNAAINFTAFKQNVTNTASGASSLLVDLQVDSTSKFKVDKAGMLTIPQGASSGYKWSHGVGITSQYSNMLFSAQYRSWVASVYSTSGSVYGFQVQNTAVIGFTSDTNGTPQTGISRLADASIALGNGTAGDFSGSLKLTDLTAVGNGVFGTSADAAGVGGDVTLYQYRTPMLHISANNAWSSPYGLKLEVTGSIRAGMLVNNSSGEVQVGALSAGGYYTTLYANNAEAMRLSTTGTVSIGSTSTAARFTVADTTLAGSGSLVGSVATFTQTWNTTGDAVAKSTDITNTASGAGSLVERWRVDGTVIASISKAGYFVANRVNGWSIMSGVSDKIYIRDDNGYIVFGSTSHLVWTDGSAGATRDTNLSRGGSPGVVSVGTGTAGSEAGQLNLTTLKVAGVTYANRPATPVAGMEVTITDSNTAVWGATVAGGGANNIKARYNGSAWTVVGV